MNFTARDRAQIERIRKKEQQWRAYRWIVVGLGLLELGVAVWGFVWATRHAEELGASLGEFRPVSLFLLATLGTKIEILFALGLFTLIYAWRRWRGSPEHVLLLSIVAGLDQQDSARR